jgi:tetratricopeptide (TPR) repeat protein
MYLFFNSKIKLLDQALDTTAVIELAYQKNGKSYKKKDLVALHIYPKNSLIWNDLKKIGTFLTYQDPIILETARKIITNKNQDSSLPSSLYHCLLIANYLKNLPLRYINDPNTPYQTFAGQEILVDTVQFPRETLLIKSGDCDDLSILIASLLESIGFSTALASLPGHLLVLVQMPDSFKLASLIEYQGKNWLPLETTILEKGFLKSWQAGFKKISGSFDQLQIVTTYEATQKYTPFTFEKPSETSLDIKASMPDLNQEIDEVKNFIKNDAPAKIESFTALELNEMGVSQARLGNLTGAEKYFLNAIRKEKAYQTPYYNLFQLYIKLSEKTKALKLYDQFNKIYPEDKKAVEILKLLLSK